MRPVACSSDGGHRARLLLALARCELVRMPSPVDHGERSPDAILASGLDIDFDEHWV
jgi:hypothetical protein